MRCSFGLVRTPSILYYNDDAAKPHFPHEAFVIQGTCLNPRDLVYSFLGLSNSPTPFVAVDYSKPVDEVFLDFALAACHGSEANLVADSHLLYYVRDRSLRITPNLPSWVPDLNAPCHPILWSSKGGWRVYSAGGPPDSKLLFWSLVSAGSLRWRVLKRTRLPIWVGRILRR